MSLPVRTRPGLADLEGFLFADVGTQPNGLPLTVLSLFARAGLDPWVEAERLSHLSTSAAVSYMVAEISRMPPRYRSQVDIGDLAETLVARLPSRAPAAPFHFTVGRTGFEGAPMLAFMMMFYAILTVGLLALLFGV